MVVEEPVRGAVPPPWVFSLPGSEINRLYAEGRLPWQPFSRLVGLRVGHTGPGSVTCRMRATDWLVALPYELNPLIATTLYAACLSGLTAGVMPVPISYNVDYFRTARAGAGSFLCSATVVNLTRRFIFAQATVEDAEGRRIAHASGQAKLEGITPPPPPPPTQLPDVDEARYATPDPIDRPVVGAAPAPEELWNSLPGLEVLRRTMVGELPRLPAPALLGHRIDAVEVGRAVLSMPASEWFCHSQRTVSPGAIAALGGAAAASAALSRTPAGSRMVVLEQSTRFLREIPADGRPVTAVATAGPEEDISLVDVQVRDADGLLVAQGSHVGAHIRRRIRPAPSRRILATILFTDIVGSTDRVAMVGDEAWARHLDDFRSNVRSTLAIHEGAEVNTTGDGFVARFDSPGKAVACARGIRDAVSQNGLEVRTGIHTGECELHGDDLTGVAVHAAARIQGVAQPGQVVVSSVVRDLVAGSGFTFEPLGEVELKGIPGSWSLHGLTT